jgi:hypothetical protein
MGVDDGTHLPDKDNTTIDNTSMTAKADDGQHVWLMEIDQSGMKG